MIKVKHMKPFYTKVEGKKLRLVFAYQYISIFKEDEEFHFVPMEGKQLIVDIETRQVQNLSDVFVFQKGNKFIRLPVYQLLLVSNIHEYLMPLINSVNIENPKIYEKDEMHIEINHTTEKLMDEIMEFHKDNLINFHLEVKNYDELEKLQEQGVI